jgi:transposase-like protein
MAEKRTRRRFTTASKAQAVKRLLEGGRELSEVAAELGLSTGMRNGRPSYANGPSTSMS